MPWRPQLRTAVDLTTLSLDPQQEFLLACLDGSLDVEALTPVTGLSPERLHATLMELATLGAIEPEQAVFEASEEPQAKVVEAEAEPETVVDASEPEVEPEPDASDPEARLTHRSLFEQKLHHHATDERAALSRQAEEPELSAYCFDPMAQVIQELLQNPRFGLAHARLVATHHRTSAGLEMVTINSAFTSDAGVRRALLQNPVLPASIYRRNWGPRRLQEQYLVASSHEVPEQTRAMARELLRASFGQRTADEKAELILKTEGRCLPMLGGVTVDGHTASILCRRAIVSTLFIQNIARWSAAPPQLIAHLLRQEIVRRNTQLKLMLERHPNANA